MPDNYENNIPPVPPLDVALTRLFDLDPTRDALAHYRTNRHLLKDGALRWWGGIINGARSNEFTVTNVFSSEEPGLSIHDIVHRDYLDLENLPPDLPRMWRQTAGCDEAEDVDIWSGCRASCIFRKSRMGLHAQQSHSRFPESACGATP